MSHPALKTISLMVGLGAAGAGAACLGAEGPWPKAAPRIP